MQVAVHEHSRARRGERGVGPVAPARHGPALIQPDPGPEPFAQDAGRGWGQLGAGELANGGLGALARHRVVQGGQERRELLASAVWVYRVRDFKQGRPWHPPGDQEQRVGAGGDDLRQVRDRGCCCERSQDADLIRQTERGGARPGEFRDEPVTEGRAG